MPTISSGNLDILRGPGHKSAIYMSVLVPSTLWSARINDSGILTGETSIAFDTGSGSSFGAIEALQEVWVGTTAGDYDVGRLRIRSVTSGDGGVTGTLTVARNAVTFTDDLHLTFTHNYPLKPLYPLIEGPPLSATFYKDGDITYTNQNDDTYPVCIAGENRANFIDQTLGYWEVTSQLPDSYATASGATISSYSVSVFPTTGVTTNVNGGTGVGYIRFATSGIYWAKWSVTDSNGLTQNTYRWYYAHSTDYNNADFPHNNFSLTQMSGDWERGGWESGVNVHDEGAVYEIPDKTGVIVWSKNYYEEIEDYITFLPDDSNTLLNGYVRKETLEKDYGDGLKDCDFIIETINSLMNNHYMFSVSLAARSSPSEWYEYTANLTIPQAIHHFWKWHSTLFEVCDVFLGDNTLGRAYAELEDGTLYTMADDLSRNKGIRAHVVCNKGGQVYLTYDIQLLTDTERSALTVVQEIEPEDMSGDLTIIRQPFNVTAFVKTSGFAWDGTFSSSGCPDPPCPNAEPLCASAPGQLPSDEGANIVDFDRQVFEDQDHANQLAGRFFAKLNNRYPEVRVNFHGNYAGVLDIHLPEFWTISIGSTDSVREIVWVSKKLICRTVRVVINVAQGTITPNVIFEAEQDGFDGVPGYCLDEFPEIPGTGDIPIPSELGGLDLVAFNNSGSCHVRSSTNWVLRNGVLTGSNVIDHHGDQDPYWRDVTKQNSTDPADAILIKVNSGKVYRTTNEGVSWSDVTPGTNPPNGEGDAVAPTAGNVTYRWYDGSWENINEHYIIATRLVDGNWRSWIWRTADDFSTGSWGQLSEVES